MLFKRVGPYHWARMSPLCGKLDLHVGVFENNDKGLGYSVQTGRFSAESGKLLPNSVDSRFKLTRWLDALKPDAVAIPGWHEPLALEALSWCLRVKTPAMLMTDSTSADRRRN